MDLHSEKLLASAALGALSGFLLRGSPLLGAALGVGSALVLETYFANRYPDAGGGFRPGVSVVPSAPRPVGLTRAQSVLPLKALAARRLAPAAATDPQVGWVGEEALDPIHRALWAVDHGRY